MSVFGKDKLALGIYYSAPGVVTGTLERIRVSPFARSKALQSVPGKLILSATGTVKNKVATFSFSEQEMNRLSPGYYNFSITSNQKGSYKGFGPLTLATIQVAWDGGVDPSDWTMPKTLRASVGQQYLIVTPITKDGKLPTLSVSSNSKKVATLSADGILTAKKTGTATITVRDTAGAKLKCKVTVVGNSYSCARPLMLKGNGLYTSTKRLYYQNGALVAEVFVYNRTGATIRGADEFILELWDGEQLVLSRPLYGKIFRSVLKDKMYKTFKVTLKDGQLPGVSEKAYDLGNKRYNAVIRGTDRHGNQTVPLASWTKGAYQPKAQNARSAGMEEEPPPTK